jgi:hypothetical protein
MAHALHEAPSSIMAVTIAFSELMTPPGLKVVVSTNIETP